MPDHRVAGDTPTPRPTVRAVVLAAGAARRFGDDKLLADLGGRPVLQHVLDRLAEAGLDDPVVVLAADREQRSAGLAWRRATRVVNPRPDDGLSSSLRIGWAAVLSAEPQLDAVLIVLGDQPRVDPALVRALVEAPLDQQRPLVAPRFRGGGGPNPLRVEATAASLVAGASGDRGLGPLIESAPQLVRWLEAEGENPDIDVPADLSRLGDP